MQLCLLHRTAIGECTDDLASDWWELVGPRILAATGGEKIILSGHRQRLTEIEVAVISYELRSLDLSSFVRLS